MAGLHIEISTTHTRLSGVLLHYWELTPATGRVVVSALMKTPPEENGSDLNDIQAIGWRWDVVRKNEWRICFPQIADEEIHKHEKEEQAEGRILQDK